MPVQMLSPEMEHIVPMDLAIEQLGEGFGWIQRTCRGTGVVEGGREATFFSATFTMTES